MAQFLCLSNDDDGALYVNVESIRAIEVKDDASVVLDFGHEQKALDGAEGQVLLDWLSTVTIATGEGK